MELLDSTLTYFGHKAWTAKDRMKLTLAYQSGADLKTISRIVKRSITATNKALTRYGIREKFGKKNDQNRNITFRRKRPLTTELDSAIEKFIADYAFDMEEDAPVRSKKVYFRYGKPVLDADCFERRLDTEIFLKKTQLLLEARKMGLAVKPLNNAFLVEKGFSCTLGAFPLTDAQLLVQVNSNRRLQKLPIFCVYGITCD